MTDIVPQRNIIQVEEVAFESGVSEGTFNRMGAAINYQMERTFYEKSVVMNGFYRNGPFDNGMGGAIRIGRTSNILSYDMYIRYTGTADDNIFNFKVYDASGSLIGDLFGAGASRLLLSGDNQEDVLVGKEGIQTTPVNINFNTSGTSTVQNGSLNLTQLPAGYVLVPYIEDHGASAFHLSFNLRLAEV